MGLAALVAGSLLLAGCSESPTAASSVTTADDTPSRVTPAQPSPTAPTGCPSTALSSGPVTSQVVVVTTSAPSAPRGTDLAVKTEIVALSDGPRIIARPQWSALEVIRAGAVVGRSVGPAGPDVPVPITGGTTIPAQTVPTRIALNGCDGQPLAPGTYQLRALVGYGSDALNSGQGGAPGAFVVASEPVDLTVT